MELEEKFKRQLNKNQSLESIIEANKAEISKLRNQNVGVERDLIQRNHEVKEVRKFFEKFKEETEKEVNNVHAVLNARRDDGFRFFKKYVEKTVNDRVKAETILMEYCKIVLPQGKIE